MNRTRTSLAVLATAAALVVAGCSDDGSSVRDEGSGSASGSGSGSGPGTGSGSAECTPTGTEGATEVEVTLDEFTVTPSTKTVAAGRILFEAKNAGEHAHELVVVKGTSPTALPLVETGNEKGKVDEDKLPAGAFIGEIEAFAPGEECSGSFALDKGSYVLFCNLVEVHGSMAENHFQEGMHTTFTVT